MDKALAAPASGDKIGALIQSLDKNDWQTVTTKATTDSSALAGNLTLHDGIPKGVADPAAPSVVVVDKGHHLTHVLQMHNGRLEDVLTVPDSVGKHTVKTETPIKRWEVSDKRLDPVWYPPKGLGTHPVAPFKENPHNPIGLAFIRLDGTNFGLHGTNRPDQIGKSISHGCMRHNNADIMKIYPLVKVGTPVYTVANFNGAEIRVSDIKNK